MRQFLEEEEGEEDVPEKKERVMGRKTVDRHTAHRKGGVSQTHTNADRVTEGLTDR